MVDMLLLTSNDPLIRQTTAHAPGVLRAGDVAHRRPHARVARRNQSPQRRRVTESAGWGPPCGAAQQQQRRPPARRDNRELRRQPPQRAAAPGDRHLIPPPRDPRDLRPVLGNPGTGEPQRTTGRPGVTLGRDRRDEYVDSALVTPTVRGTPAAPGRVSLVGGRDPRAGEAGIPGGQGYVAPGRLQRKRLELSERAGGAGRTPRGARAGVPWLLRVVPCDKRQGGANGDPRCPRRAARGPVRRADPVLGQRQDRRGRAARSRRGERSDGPRDEERFAEGGGLKRAWMTPPD
eukprot:1183095-Prorocentrum_minimum.AAC.3